MYSATGLQSHISKMPESSKVESTIHFNLFRFIQCCGIKIGLLVLFCVFVLFPRDAALFVCFSLHYHVIYSKNEGSLLIWRITCILVLGTCEVFWLHKMWKILKPIMFIQAITRFSLGKKKMSQWSQYLITESAGWNSWQYAVFSTTQKLKCTKWLFTVSNTGSSGYTAGCHSHVWLNILTWFIWPHPELGLGIACSRTNLAKWWEGLTGENTGPCY